MESREPRSTDGIDSGGLGHLVSGWLKKRGPSHTYSWRPRWCVLTPRELVSYRDPQLQTKIGSVQLSPNAQVFRISELLAPGEAIRHKREKPFGFVLDADPGGGKDRRLEYFDAGDADTLKAWISGVANAVRLQGTPGGAVEASRQVLSATHLESEVVLASTGSAGDAYLARHGIPTLFNEWAAMLARYQPQDPFAFLSDRMLELNPHAVHGNNGGASLSALRFSDTVETLAAASASAGPGRKDLRQRVNTGYLRDSDVDVGLAPRFRDDVEELDAASEAASSKRSVRTRVNTGFVREGEATDSRQGPRFDDAVLELDAASEASGRGKHSVRARVNTGFVGQEDPPSEDATPQQGNARGLLRFDDKVVQLEAASTSSGAPKAVRARVNTGFVHAEDLASGDAASSRKGLRFDDDVQEMAAASQAAGGGRKEVRARVNTGFIRPDDLPEDPSSQRKGLSFSDQVEEVAAASAAVGAGSGSAVRQRVNTGFVREEDLPFANRRGLQFADQVEELEAASFSVGGPKQSIRARVNTGYAFEDDVPKTEPQRGARFADDVEEICMSSTASGGSRRSATTTASEDKLQECSSARETKGLRFNNDVEELAAASAASGAMAKPVRARSNTGFVRDEDIPATADSPQGRGLRFGEAEEVEAASEGASQAKPVRQRVNTGFVREDEAAPAGGGGIRFSDNVVEVDAASEATQGSRKQVRGRVNTGYVHDSDLPAQGASGLRFEEEAQQVPAAGADRPKNRGLQFSDQVEEHAAASVSAGRGAQPVRARVNTGFVKQEDLPDTGSQRQGLRFQDAVQEFDAASSASGSSAKPVRGRINTGFVRDDETPDPESSPPNSQQASQPKAAARFSDNVDIMDAASSAAEGPKRSIRSRVNTGFAFEADAPPDEAANRKGLQFASNVEELEAASEASSAPARSVRARVNTGFIHEAPDGSQTDASEAPKAARFSDNVEQLVAASEASGGAARSIRARVNTGFAFEMPDDSPVSPASNSRAALRFADTAEEVDAASAAAEGPKRSIRTRVNTGFAFEQEAPSPTEADNGAKRLQFTTTAPEELDAASAAVEGAAKRSIRSRVNTGFAFDQEMPSDDSVDKRSLKFATDGDEVVDAASEGAGGQARTVRERVGTGFVFEKGAKPKGVTITDSVEQVDAASSTSGAPARSIRTRVNTGFVFEEAPASPTASPTKPSFGDNVEVLEAASEAADAARNVRSRVGTGYVHQKDAPNASPTSDNKELKFSGTVEEVDAASSAVDGPKRSVRARVNTGYAFEKDLPADAAASKKGLQFAGQVEELEAASSAVESGPKRSVRARVNTGFAFEAPPDSDPGSPGASPPTKHARVAQAPPEELEAASAGTDGPSRSIRARVNTGFAFESNVPPAEEEGRQGLKFAGAVEELEAASEASGGQARSIRARVNTGYAFSQDVPPVEDTSMSPVSRTSPARHGLRFDDAVEIVEAASRSPQGSAAVRSRMATGFVPAQAEDDAEEGGAANTGGVAASNGTSPEPAAALAKPPALKPSISGGSTRSSVRSSLAFSDDVTELQAASEFGEVRRSVRSRMNTSFAWGEEASSDEDDEDWSDDDDDEEEESEEEECGPEPSGDMGHRDSINVTSDRATRRMVNRQSSRGMSSRSPRDSFRLGSSFRSSMLRRRLSSGQESRKSLRMSLHRSGIDARRKLQHCATGLSDGPIDGPEAEIDMKLVEDAQKDEAMLTSALRPLALFDDLDAEVLEDLIFAMQVYEFKDKEEVLRQGDIGGTHFYVVASGEFEIVKDGKVVDGIGVGATFGESVLLIDGHRTATVRAKGVARVYGLEAQDVRDALHWHYEQEHKEVLGAIDKILESDSCEQLQHLNAFQLHALFGGTEVRQFRSAEVIQHEGRCVSDEVYVLTQGAVILRTAGVDVRRVRRCTMFGMRAMLFGYANFAAIADGSTKLLAIPKTVLEEIFEAKSLSKVLMKPEILRSLNNDKTLQEKLDEDQREALANNFDVVEVRKNRPYKSTDARFLMGLDAGKFEVSRDAFRQDITTYEGSINDIVGIETLLDSSLPWDMQIRVESERTHIAVWTQNEVNSVLEKDVTKDRAKIMKGIFLFRTLAQEQLRRLAVSMESVKLNDGEPVFNQGDVGDTFCIIALGRVVIERNGRYIRALSKGDYFGERALLTKEPRSATVKASGPCEIWSISRDTFTETMTQHAIDYLKGRFALQDSEYTFDDLTFKRVIGTGGFGVVKMVETKTGDRYALKCVQKPFVVERKQQSMLLNERMVLNEIDHPFIVKLVQTFKNDAYVYFLMELVSGGELLSVLNDIGVLNKTQAHFYTGSIILALEHLHDRRIAYLDLKSENILIDDQGYIKLVDFGLAVKLVGAQNHQVRGTPHFMAPEMILSKGYDTTADLWTLGICLYEFMIGRFPFGHNSTKKSEIFNAVLKSPLLFPEDFQTKSYAEESMDFIRGLLDRRPTKRIGGGIEGYKAFKVHRFFVGFDWDALLARKVKPPYEPNKEVYAEGSETLQSISLAKVEADAEKELLKNDWVDPDPGWDDDFTS